MASIHGLGIAVLVAALTTAGAVAPSATAPPGGRDVPSDAPPSAVRALAAGTTLEVDEAAREARLRVDEGGTLDQYLFGPGPITFDLDLQGFSPDPVAGRPVTLTMRVFDVDQAGGPDCGPEVDRVSVNGRPVGTLTGANDQWSLTTFSVPAGVLTSGTNAFRVDIDTGGTGCWAVEVDWAQVTLPFAIAHVATDATDDVDVRRGLSDDEIPDRVFQRSFDASGGLNAPTADDPVADAVNSTTWYGSATASRFTYRYTLDAWPARPSWTPNVAARWQFSGGGGSGSGPAGGVDGWEGDLAVDLPTSTGRYDLTVWLTIRKDGTELVEQVRRTTVYVLLGDPVSTWSLTAPNTSTPKTQWLDQAFRLGAAGRTAGADVVEGLTHGIYGNPLGWSYPGGSLSSARELIEATGTRGQCRTFSEVLMVLARSVGVNVSLGSYADSNFLTGTRPALDGNASANAAPLAGGPPDRWLFGSHWWGTYGGNRYDPTFGIIGADTPAAFFTDAVQCRVTGASGGVWFCPDLTGPSVFRLYPGGPNAAGWPSATYERTTPPAPRQQRVDETGAPPGGAALLAPTAVTQVAQRLEDTDGNGLADWLAVDVPTPALVTGDQTYVLDLFGPDGAYVTTGTFDPVADNAPVLTVARTAGEPVGTVYFRGQAIRATGVDGAVRVVGEHRHPDGTVSGIDVPLAPVDHRDFQGPPAELGTVTDELVDDALRLHVPVTPTGTGPLVVDVQLLAGTTQVGAVSQQVTLTAGVVQDVVVDVPAAPIWSSGLDGPYTAHVTVTDASGAVGATHTTAAYDADALAPPAVRVLPGVTDAGVDADGDGLFDTIDVTAQVVAATPGPVTVHAALRTDDGTPVTSATVTVDAGPGPTPVTLPLPGRDVVRVGADGPYDVALEVTDAAGNGSTRVHRTAAYTVAQLDAPVALLTGSVTDAPVDLDADGSPDVLRLDVGVRVMVDGDVRLRGALVDAEGTVVAEATTEVTSAPSERTIALDVDGADLVGRAGPFVLSGVELGPVGEPPEVAALDLHTTAAYPADLFRSGATLGIESVTDRGLDEDGDGLFEALAVDVALQVKQSGYHYLNGQLTDATGDEIQWAGTQAYLEAGRHVLTLRYDGRLISGRAVDGPYRVEGLSVYADPTQPVTPRTPHVTAAYTWQQFELGAAVTGRVTSDAGPVVGAAVAVPGVAFDVTDETGAYRLGLPGGGTYEVVVSADPALEPWRVVVDGVERATGTSVVVDVTDGGSTTVDFVSGTSAAPTGFVPLDGVTVADSRTGTGLPRGRVVSADVPVAGVGGVPTTDVAAVALRVQALDPQGRGEVRVGPAGAPVHVAFGVEDATGLAVVPVQDDGSVHLSATGRPHVVVSVAGYLPAASGYTAVAPTRLTDVGPPCPAFTSVTCSRDVPVAGRGGVPGTGVAAVVLTASAVRPLVWGTTTVHGTGEPVPRVPTLTYAPLRPDATTVVVPLDDAGRVRVTTLGSRVHTLSVVGWLPEGSFTAVPPTFVANTPHSTTVQVTGVGGVPATGTGTVALQVAAYGGPRGGTVTVHPSDAPAPAAADLLAPRLGGTTGLVLVRPAADGTVRVAVTGAGTRAHVEVVGWSPGG